jgi:DNA-binding response OmpR family regulator
MARILVIDDEPNIRKMVGMALAQGGHAIAEAADGPEGLRLFGKGLNWDLVLLDQRMPGMEGLEVLRRIREVAPLANVVFMTAYATLDLALDAVDAGAGDFLRKPFPIETLRGAVDAVLGRDTAAVPRATHPSKDDRLGFTTLNGYRVEPVREPAIHRNGEIRQTVVVRAPNGNVTPVVVVVPPYLAEHIRRKAGDLEWPSGGRFWQDLAEEMVANYVWNNAGVPMGAVLRRGDYEGWLGRWLETVTGHHQAL